MWGIYSLHSVSEWRSALIQLARICDAIDFLYSACRGKHETKSGVSMRHCKQLDVDVQAYMLESAWFFAHCIA
jgi:L-asparaginase II